MQIYEITDTDRLIEMRDDWLGLWRRAAHVTPFQHPDWLIPWWMLFGPGVLRVVVAVERGRLIALAPLFGVDGVCYWLGAGVTDYLDLLLDDDCDENFVISDYISNITCQLDCLRDGSLALTIPGERWISGVSPVLSLPASQEIFESSLSPHFRKNLRRALHALESQGRVRIGVATPSNVQEMLSALFMLHGRRWSERHMPGVLRDEAIRAFHRYVAERFIMTGMLRLYTMLLNFTPIASLYVLDGRDEAHFYLSAFDPAFARYSPGALLLRTAISDAIARGATEFHFLRGKEDYKYRWNATDRPLWTLRIIRFPN